MTVPVRKPREDYIENGSTLVHPVPFEFEAADELVVARIAAGAVTILARGPDYSVSGGNGGTGSIAKTSAGTAGTLLRIVRRTPRSQPTDYTPADRFPAESHEDALDRQMRALQETDDAVDLLAGRAFLVPEGESGRVLPNAAGRASSWFAFDGAGDYLTSRPALLSGGSTQALIASDRVILANFADVPVGRAIVLTERGREGLFVTLADDDAEAVEAEVDADDAGGQGRWVKSVQAQTVYKRLGRLTPEYFRKTGDEPADVYVQRWLDQLAREIARGGESAIGVVDRPYRNIQHPLYWRSCWVEARPNGENGFHNEVNSAVNVMETCVFPGSMHPAYTATATRNHRDVSANVFQNSDAAAIWYTSNATLAGQPVRYQALDAEAAFYNDPLELEYNAAMNGEQPGLWQNLDEQYPFYTTNTNPALGPVVGDLRELYRPRQLYHDAAAATYSDRIVKVAPAVHALGLYTPGKVVHLNGTGHYYGGQGMIYGYGMWNEVRRVLYGGATQGDGHVHIELTYPIRRSVTGMKIGLGNGNPGIGGVVQLDFLGREPLSVLRKAVIEGLSFSSVQGQAVARSAMLDCQFHFDELDTRAFGFNAASYSEFSWRRLVADRKPFEWAMNSCGSVARGDVFYRKTEFSEMEILGNPARNPLLRYGEGAIDCGFEGNVFAEGWDNEGKGAIEFSADGCWFDGELHIPNARGDAVRFIASPRRGWRDETEVQNYTRDNVARVRKCKAGTTLTRYVYFAAPRGVTAPFLTGNRVEGEFESAGPPTVAAVSIGPSLGSEVVDASFQHGNIVVSADADTYEIHVELGSGGIVVGGDLLKARELTVNGRRVYPGAFGAGLTNGGAGAISFTPDATKGQTGDTRYETRANFSNSSGITVNAPTGGAAGRTVVVQLFNANQSTAIPLAVAAGIEGAGALASLTAQKHTRLTLYSPDGVKYWVEGKIENVT
ncbi:MAG TPA: hypothetical protein VGW34_09955 [Allosphingosinicella sp.]|nr:hypothetical protein [Allosphingosinicella sp.]